MDLNFISRIPIRDTFTYNQSIIQSLFVMQLFKASYVSIDIYKNIYFKCKHYPNVLLENSHNTI